MEFVETVVKIDERQHAEAVRMLSSVRQGVPRAVDRATKDTTRAARVRVVRAIASEIAVAQSKLFKKGARHRPVSERLVRGGGGLVVGGRVTVSKGRIALGRFQARQHWRKGKTQGRLRSAVSYRIDKGGSRKRVRDAFLVEFKSGYVGVYQGWKRRGRRKIRRGEWDALQLYGPSVPEVAEKRPEVRRLLNGEAARLYGEHFERRVAYLLSRAQGGRR